MHKGKKIFITEDEFIVSKNLEVKLTKLGYEVIGSSPTGEGAVQKIRKNPPDLILMDIMLAGDMDGIETARIIRSEYDIPVIFLTAYSSKEIYNRAALAEPYAYIIKPFEERELEINIAISLYKNNIEKAFAEKQKQLEELNNNLDILVEERTSKLLSEIAQKREAQDSKSRFFKIIEQTNDHVMLADLESVIEYVNPALCEFTGYSKEELIGKSPEILKSGMYEKDYFEDVSKILHSGKSYSDEIINVTKGGEYYTSIQSIIPLKNQDGEITHFASISRENTRQIEYERKLTHIQEEERKRISKELHDGVGQSVAAIKLAVNSIDVNNNDKNGKVVSDLNSMLEDLTASIREISYNLMPSILSDYGLSATLNKTIKQIESTTNLNLMLCNELNESLLDADVRLSLFRIFQEAINNTIKYASAENVKITLSDKKSFVYMTLEDDGKGFEISDKNIMSSGQGIQNMKHRSTIHKGVFSISSEKNEGTKIKIKIPVNGSN